MREMLDYHSVSSLLEEALSACVAPTECLIVAISNTGELMLLEKSVVPIGTFTERSLTLASVIDTASVSFAGWPLEDVFLILEKEGDTLFFGVAKRTAFQKPN